MNLKNVLIRSLSGAIYVALIVLGVITTDWAFVAFSTLFTLLGVREFLVMTKADGSKLNLWVDVIAASSLVALGGYLQFIKNTSSLLWLSAILLVYVLLRSILQLYNKKETPINSLATSMFALIYVIVPMLTMSAIYAQSQSLLLLIFVMIWMNDTGAFLVGCTFGKHRLFERISPKKSWEGFWGGVVFSVLSGVVYYYLIEQTNGMAFYVILGIIASVFATFGDLVESMFKRSLGVKDSGNLIPGHGGILDRIDSLLFVLPATALYLYIYLAI